MFDFVGVSRPLLGMREGVTMTVGILGGGDPMTVAIGEEFHLGRDSRGISPPVPVLTPGPTEGVLDRGVNRGILSRLDREDGGWEETDRLRGVVLVLLLG
jgi:hypothetical protein